MMNHKENHPLFAQAGEQFAKGLITRRELLRIAGLLGMSAVAANVFRPGLAKAATPKRAGC